MCIYLSLSEVIIGMVTAKKKSKKSLLLSLYLKKTKTKFLTAIEHIYLIYSEKNSKMRKRNDTQLLLCGYL